MRRDAKWASLAAIALVGCSRPDPSPKVAVKSVASEASPDASASASLGPLAPATLSPELPPFEQSMMDHMTTYGWSADGASFGGCSVYGGTDGDVCTFRSPSGAIETFGNVDAKTGTIDPKKAAALDAKVAAMKLSRALGRTRFPDVELTWKSVLGDADVSPPKPGHLLVGARVKGEPTVWPIDLSAGGYHRDVHPELIALSPDGAFLGVIGHAFAGEFSDTFPEAVVPMGAVAAKAYRAAAAVHAKKGDATGSATFEAKARMAESAKP